MDPLAAKALVDTLGPAPGSPRRQRPHRRRPVRAIRIRQGAAAALRRLAERLERPVPAPPRHACS